MSRWKRQDRKGETAQPGTSEAYFSLVPRQLWSLRLTAGNELGFHSHLSG